MRWRAIAQCPDNQQRRTSANAVIQPAAYGRCFRSPSDSSCGLREDSRSQSISLSSCGCDAVGSPYTCNSSLVMPIRARRRRSRRAAKKPRRRSPQSADWRLPFAQNIPRRRVATHVACVVWPSVRIRPRVYAIIRVFNGFRGVARGNGGCSRSSKVKSYAHALLWSG